MRACFLRTQPSMSPSAISWLREEIAEEFPVVDLGGPGRHLVGDLPSQGHQGPLPGGDVMVLGVGDHSIEIEQDGAWRHEKHATRSERTSRSEPDYPVSRAARQIIDKARPGPYGACSVTTPLREGGNDGMIDSDHDPNAESTPAVSSTATRHDP